MVLKRCEKGHFYNGDKYAQCNKCSKAAQPVTGYSVKEPQAFSYTSRTAGVVMPREEDSVTVPLFQQGEDSVTVPLSAQAVSGGSLREAVQKAAGNAEDDEHTISIYQTNTGIEPVTGWLVCIKGEDFGASFTIKSGRNFIGRSAGMDIVLHGDQSISREKHAVVLYEPKQREFIAQVGESRELFYVNDEVVLNPVRLKKYDVLAIGNTSLMFFPCCGENFSWEDFSE